MKIKNKDYKFLYTVKASIEIAKKLPGHSISQISEVFKKGDQIESMELISHMAVCMNEAYLRYEAYSNGTEFNPDDVLKKEDIEFLTMAEEQALENEIVQAYTNGNKTEIETEEVKTKGKKGKKTKEPSEI